MKAVIDKHGDFTVLATNYSKYRAGYSETVLTALLSLIEKTVQSVDIVDVGAGTGIWSRMMAQRGCRSLIAIEPNDEMRKFGKKDCTGLPIIWKKGCGETTGLAAECCDFLTMASSFHWVDFDKGIREFHRVLRPGGRFTAIWNPRLIETNQLLVEIEQMLFAIAPNIKRRSSGRSGITENLTDRLMENFYFDDVLYIEGRHTERQTPEHYIGIWWSVNDVRIQAGEKRFKQFMDYVESRVKEISCIETTYLTRAWTARKK